MPPRSRARCERCLVRLQWQTDSLLGARTNEAHYLRRDLDETHRRLAEATVRLAEQSQQISALEHEAASARAAAQEAAQGAAEIHDGAMQAHEQAARAEADVRRLIDEAAVARTAIDEFKRTRRYRLAQAVSRPVDLVRRRGSPGRR